MKTSNYTKIVKSEFKSACIKDRQFLKAFNKMVQAESQNHLIDDVDRFGEPRDVVASYLDNTLEVCRYKKQGHIIKTILLTLICLVLISSIYENNRQNGKKAYIYREIVNLKGE